MHMIVQSVRLRDTILFTASRCVSKVGPPKLIKKIIYRSHWNMWHTIKHNRIALNGSVQCACQEAVIVSCLQACFAIIIIIYALKNRRFDEQILSILWV